ncbi:hypothetical protein BFJ63_vAg9955 [Fusarium oxysporum f. sp. narcissi]|uniref:Uncharacterized protein n=2 Tax=Fusarium oxysporum TaxID=5507 RepID=A0A4Q2VL95_FUSOX|nr:hypothetical protein BFJ65_g16760 [Fusarium oxysporum f. sp. cepae]RKK45359.1 hypothetical protein BFJ66_g9125 [Fusarium oxysporum f. sp. cepae]RKK45381.1 hypothetical protein BFJ67_g8668 [Fusarium oxysporum f. sp. cepae]RYC87145.1 hypothetical protein BFJ63_vAg9955 [Fusarium oxysporum f. sp. narcissi]
MESNSPFEKLPAELITIILSTTNSPADIQSIVRADPTFGVFSFNTSILSSGLLYKILFLSIHVHILRI